MIMVRCGDVWYDEEIISKEMREENEGVSYNDIAFSV